MATRIPKSENLISTLLLVGLAGIVVWVFSGAFRPKAAMEKPVRSAYPLPAGWKITVKWETYPNGKLYEKIDGREPLFLEYGVTRLDFAAAEFKKSGKGFDIYRYQMRDADGALGVYLAAASGEAKELDLGSMADISGGELRVFQGSVYLEIQPQEKAPDEKLARELAQALLAGIKAPKSSGSGILDLLPKTGRIKGSLAINKESVFGLKSLSGTYSAAYEENGRQIDYLVRKISSSEGQKVLEIIRDEIKEFEGKIVEFKPDRLSAELFGKKLILVLDPNLLLGAYGEEANMDALLKKLRKPKP
jgi:hypothetical protein